MRRDLSEALDNAIAGAGILRRPADALRSLFTKLFLESPFRPIKNFLNGTWLEHPLHPVLTDVPIGAWTIALVLDIAALFFGLTNLGEASAIAIGFGVLAALGSIITGLMDYTDLDPPEGAVAFTHGIVNILATIFFSASFVMRFIYYWSIDYPQFLLSLIGYALVTFGGFLGGSLVYRTGVMVNRNAYRSGFSGSRGGLKEYTSVLAFNDLPENKPRRVEVKGQPILLVRRGQRVYAVAAVCSHYGGPLEQGALEDTEIECPWHYSHFSLEDGRVKRGPATSPLPAYDTDVKDGQIRVKLRT